MLFIMAADLDLLKPIHSLGLICGTPENPGPLRLSPS
jgi:hypothetical protein